MATIDCMLMLNASVDNFLRAAGELPLPAAVLGKVAAEAAGWEADKAAARVQGESTETRGALIAAGRARMAAVVAAIESGLASGR